MYSLHCNVLMYVYFLKLFSQTNFHIHHLTYLFLCDLSICDLIAHKFLSALLLTLVTMLYGLSGQLCVGISGTMPKL